MRLIALVNGAYHEKDDVYNKHITALEAIDDDSEAAVQLIEATLAVATPVELLERKQLFVGGLTHFKGHTVALKEKCAPNLIITLKESFAQTAETVLALGALDTDATDSTTSTAAGEGLAVAKVGEASEFVLSAVAVGSGEQRRFGGDKVNVTLVRAGAVELQRYIDITIKLYGPQKLELGMCKDLDYTKNLGGRSSAAWTSPELMGPICKLQCGCAYPDCPDQPDDPAAGKFCSLCGPRFNQYAAISLFGYYPPGSVC